MKLWAKKANSAPLFIEADGSFITKPTNIENYFNDFSLARLANLGMTCQQQMLTLRIQVYLTKLWKTRIVILNSLKSAWKR